MNHRCIPLHENYQISINQFQHTGNCIYKNQDRRPKEYKITHAARIDRSQLQFCKLVLMI